jgi:hypothetical protein
MLEIVVGKLEGGYIICLPRGSGVEGLVNGVADLGFPRYVAGLP